MMAEEKQGDNRLVLASGNKGKLAEFDHLLAPYGFQVIPQSQLEISSAVEDGLSFLENALIKARHAARCSGLPALADDSGISVSALKGKPGIYSARYAGEGASDQENIDQLLSALADCPAEDRAASFHCVLVFMRHAEDPVPIIAHGEWQGRILEQRDGDAGFGYDPVFWAPEYDCSAARLSREQKNAVSHRGKAMARLKEQMIQARLIT